MLCTGAGLTISILIGSFVLLGYPMVFMWLSSPKGHIEAFFKRPSRFDIPLLFSAGTLVGYLVSHWTNTRLLTDIGTTAQVLGGLSVAGCAMLWKMEQSERAQREKLRKAAKESTQSALVSGIVNEKIGTVRVEGMGPDGTAATSDVTVGDAVRAVKSLGQSEEDMVKEWVAEKTTPLHHAARFTTGVPYGVLLYTVQGLIVFSFNLVVRRAHLWSTFLNDGFRAAQE